VRSAAEEYHAEFAAKEATIAALTVEADTARSLMQAEIDALRAEMEVIQATPFSLVLLFLVPCMPVLLLGMWPALVRRLGV
jgi:Fe2+ transport system protein B